MLYLLLKRLHCGEKTNKKKQGVEHTSVFSVEALIQEEGRKRRTGDDGRLTSPILLFQLK